jgi:hypothetical protein
MSWANVAGAAVGVVGNAMMSGGGGSTGGNPNTYVPLGREQLDQNYQNAFNTYGGQIDAMQQSMNPFYAQSFTNQYYNPGAPGYAQGADQASQLYGSMVPGTMDAAGRMFNTGNAIGDMGLDPRQSQYNRARDQLTENVRSGEYARGITMTPYGAAVEGGALGQFQNDWQNQQLQRALSAGRGQAQAYQGGAGLGNTAGQMQLTAAQLPFQARNDIYGTQNQAIGNFWGQQSPYMQGLNQLQSNALGYMNGANSAANQAFGNNMATSQMNQQAIGQIAGPVGNAIVDIYKNWNQPTPYAGGGNGTGMYTDPTGGVYNNPSAYTGP